MNRETPAGYATAEQIRDSYDRLAETYAELIYRELDGKPFDREWLDRLAAAAGKPGPIADIGCGPGQIARYLHDRGAAVMGIDLSPVMVDFATRLNPGIPFHEGNMLALDLPDGALGGITAFYSLIHLPREWVGDALREFWRVLRPGGLLLVAVHEGDDVQLVDHEFNMPVILHYTFFRQSELEGYVLAAGFEIIESMTREPYAPEVEYQSRRIYILACKSA